MFIISLILVGFFMKFNPIFFVFIILPVIHLFFYQIKNLDIKNSKKILKIFKSNNLFGLIILINILVGKY